MALRSVWRPWKDEVVADGGAVASERPLTSEVGIDVLRQGGNAVDAAVAMGFCAAVVEPQSSCVAGHGQMLVHMNGRTTALDFSHRAPKAATPDMYNILRQVEHGNGLYEVEGHANAVGHLSAGVPGTIAGMCKAHEMFGTLPLEQLVEPAIHYASEGYLPDWQNVFAIGQAMNDFQKYGEPARVFLPNGLPPRMGVDKVVQRDLADTLRRVARHGKAGVYEGEVPHAVEEYMRANGGCLSAADFHDYEVVVLEPASITYRGIEILGVPVPSGCTTAMQILNVLDNFDVAALGHNSAEYLHLFVEAARHAFADRYRYLGDPDFGPVPMRGILSDGYARSVAATVDTERAALEGRSDKQPWVEYADEALHDPWVFDPQPRPLVEAAASPPSVGDCTTHYGAIDADRNMVSCTQTAVGGFGSRVIVPGTGLLLTNGMVVFNPKPGAANSIAGYKRGLANMVPLLALRDGEPMLSIGAPGGRKIMNCNAQIIMNVIDFGMGIQEAIAAPRVDAADRETYVDSRIDSGTVDALRDMGHGVEVVEETPAQGNFAVPVGLMVDGDTGRIHAGVDVFRQAEARGF
jgi:gamma-glutamyltranspeptidase/glutathione hydrolase